MTACPGCGLTLPDADGPVHPYIAGSAPCWAHYGELLARLYEGGGSAQLAVDAYAVQHPGVPGRRSAQSVWLHLATLCDVIDNGRDPIASRATHARLAGREYAWLEPPALRGRWTVGDALSEAVSVRDWAQDAWAAWRHHHAAVRALLER